MFLSARRRPATRRPGPVVATLLACLSAGCGALPPGAGLPTGGDGPLAAGTYGRTLRAVGHDWSYVVHVPASYDANVAAPLVLVLHGAGGNGLLYVENNGWKAKSEEVGAVIVAPDGLPSRPNARPNFFTNPRVWNSGQLRAGGERAQIDDVAFFGALVDETARLLNIDAKRVYVCGHSNGGSMTFRLAVELPQRFAAAASVAGVMWLSDPRPTEPLPTLFIIGTADPLVPLAGGESTLPWGKRTTPPVAEFLSRWAVGLGCDAGEPTEVSDENGVRTVQYNGCPDAAPFSAIYIEGQGHGWPGGSAAGLRERWIGPITDRLNATSAIWDLFARHARP